MRPEPGLWASQLLPSCRTPTLPTAGFDEVARSAPNAYVRCGDWLGLPKHISICDHNLNRAAKQFGLAIRRDEGAMSSHRVKMDLMRSIKSRVICTKGQRNLVSAGLVILLLSAIAEDSTF